MLEEAITALTIEIHKLWETLERNHGDDQHRANEP
jgi:hypothetical protein